MTNSLKLKSALIFATWCSGAAALMYEVLWTRSLSIILGATIPASSAIFAAFMLGLGIGALWGGRLTEKINDQLKTYILVELAIAICATLTGLALHLFRNEFTIYMGPTGTLLYFLKTISIVLIFIFLPTALIGATFPILLSATRKLDHHIILINRIYGFNTFGAACGVLLAGFITIRFLGVINSYLIASLLNLLSAYCGLRLRNYYADQATLSSITKQNRSQLHDILPSLSEKALLATTFISGFLFLAAEVLWFRLASFFVGNRTYALTTLLFCIIIFISIGSLLTPKLIAYYRNRLNHLLGFIFLIASISPVISLGITYEWIYKQAIIEPLLPAHNTFFILIYRIIETFLLMLPLMLPLGCLFPLSLSLSRHAKIKPGSTAGHFYISNSLGAVLGSLLMGHWSLVVFGTMRSIYLLIFPSLIMAFLFLSGLNKKRSGIFALIVTSIFLLISIKVIPSRFIYLMPGEKLLYHKEDAYGIFQVIRSPHNHIIVRNNKMRLISPLGSKSANFAQQMQGHLAMYYLNNPKKALVIGGGYGITAGTLSYYSEVKEIDSVEILPGMIETADFFEPYNLGYHKNPKVNVIQDDGRHFLAKTKKKYDLISINVTDPHLPGASSLFHADFYQLAKERLTPNGKVVQLISGPGIKIMLQTMTESFNHVLLFRVWPDIPVTYVGDYFFFALASDSPLKLDPQRISALYSAPNIQYIFKTIQINKISELTDYLSKGKNPDTYPLLVPESRIATDNFPRIEFFWDKNPANRLFRLY